LDGPAMGKRGKTHKPSKKAPKALLGVSRAQSGIKKTPTRVAVAEQTEKMTGMAMDMEQGKYAFGAPGTAGDGVTTLNKLQKKHANQRKELKKQVLNMRRTKFRMPAQRADGKAAKKALGKEIQRLERTLTEEQAREVEACKGARAAVHAGLAPGMNDDEKQHDEDGMDC